MRCLTLADALAAAGCEVQFVSAALPKTLSERVLGAGHSLAHIEATSSEQRSGAGWHEPPLSDEQQTADAAATGASLLAPADWMIVDHYLLGHAWQVAARSFARRLLVIDDLANRAHDCDVLLDQTLGRSAADYRHLVPEAANVLVGSVYALLRPEFVRERPAALRGRQESGPVRRILISLGTMDLGGITAKVLERVLHAAPRCALDVVLGDGAPSSARVAELAATNPCVSIHVDSSDMAVLMRDADLAIGAAGTSSWERCSLALPTIVILLAENQRRSGEALAREGAAILVENVGDVEAAVRELLGDQALRERMSAAAAAMVDGHGADRVVSVMVDTAQDISQGDLSVRLAGREDCEILWLWRNDPVTRATAKTSEPIPWRQHQQWFSTVLEDPARTLFIADVGSVPAATVRFDRPADEALISINVSPAMRGRGVGQAALEAACNHYLSSHLEVTLVAEVHRSNPASRKIFAAMGFTEIEPTDGPFARLVRRRDVPPDRSPDIV
jgi:UDP-2,4-diacetamido-2,4,6-trideoxy-beta-L-altropyranose hydrolase